MHALSILDILYRGKPTLITLLRLTEYGNYFVKNKFIPSFFRGQRGECSRLLGDVGLKFFPQNKALVEYTDHPGKARSALVSQSLAKTEPCLHVNVVTFISEILVVGQPYSPVHDGDTQLLAQK